MSSEKLVSLIVPVYNSEKTLERCITSILNQTYRNLEVIIVNDASTDSSGDIILRLEKMDPERIMAVFADENRGPGGARNIAIGYARGDYIGFVDSDDYIHAGFCEKLVCELESGNHDFVDCGYYDESKDRAIVHTGKDERGILSDEARCRLITGGGYLWSKLFRRELFTDHNISFREKCILEDSEILIEMIAFSRSVGAVEETLYWYSSTPGSASKRNDAVSFIDNIYEAIKAESSLKNVLYNYEALRPAIEYGIISMYKYSIIKVILDARGEHVLDTLSALSRLQKLRTEEITPGYENKYVREKILDVDIELMKLNDEDPMLVMKQYGI